MTASTMYNLIASDGAQDVGVEYLRRVQGGGARQRLLGECNVFNE